MNQTTFFNCPDCQKELKLYPGVAAPGDTIECPACGKDLQVPQTPLMPGQIETSDPTSSPAVTANTKPCPYCGEAILALAVKCRFCGSVLARTPRVKCNRKTATIAAVLVGLLLVGLIIARFTRSQQYATNETNPEVVQHLDDAQSEQTDDEQRALEAFERELESLWNRQ